MGEALSAARYDSLADYGVWITGQPEKLKPGMLLLLDDGRFQLVGHVNADDGGACNCCAQYQYDMSEVQAWAQLIKFEG